MAYCHCLGCIGIKQTVHFGDMWKKGELWISINHEATFLDVFFETPNPKTKKCSVISKQPMIREETSHNSAELKTVLVQPHQCYYHTNPWGLFFPRWPWAAMMSTWNCQFGGIHKRSINRESWIHKWSCLTWMVNKEKLKDRGNIIITQARSKFHPRKRREEFSRKSDTKSINIKIDLMTTEKRKQYWLGNFFYILRTRSSQYNIRLCQHNKTINYNTTFPDRSYLASQPEGKSRSLYANWFTRLTRSRLCWYLVNAAGSRLIRDIIWRRDALLSYTMQASCWIEENRNRSCISRFL